MRPITAYVKPTNYCNVGCSHCYLPEIVRANRTRMSFDTLRSTGELLLQMAQRQRAPGIHVLWHGGEPLTVPVSWYEQAGEVLDSIVEGHTQSIQTSLIPWRPEYAELVHGRFASEIGSSVDFTQRRIKGSVEAYHDLWMKKVEMARAEGIAVIPGMVPTRNEEGRGEEVMRWFEERGFSMFNIDRYNHFGTGEDADRPSNAQHARFLIGLFDAAMTRMETGRPAPIINVLTSGLRGVLYGQPGDRWGGSCQSDFVVIEPDGSTNSCPDRASFETPFSNVAEGFDGFQKSELRRRWIRTQQFGHKRPHCETCENNHFCKSGCPITPNGYLDGEDECSGYHLFLSHLRRYVALDRNKKFVLAYLAGPGKMNEGVVSISPSIAVQESA